MYEANQNFFSKIILSNEEILKLRTLLYGLKIRALNAQILSANSGSFAVSYGVVATEIIRFNDKLQETNDRLSEKISSVLKLASRLQKITQTNFLLFNSIEKTRIRKANSEFISGIQKRYEERKIEMEKIDTDVRQNFSDIRNIVKNSIKLCLEGRTVSLQTKIESATIVENQKLFLAVAESFDSALNVIEASYRYMIKIW